MCCCRLTCFGPCVWCGCFITFVYLLCAWFYVSFLGVVFLCWPLIVGFEFDTSFDLVFIRFVAAIWDLDYLGLSSFCLGVAWMGLRI